MSYLNMCDPFSLTINELIERDIWTDSIPSKCQDCQQPMPDNTKMVHEECDTHLEDGETCDDPRCVCHEDCEIQACQTCLEKWIDDGERDYDASREN